MIRPAFPPLPPGAIGVIPVVPRPPVLGVPGVRPIIPPAIRPAAVPNVTPAEKPQTTVYVGKIAPTVDNDFMLSLLRLCGPVKSWKRAQDPTNGTPKGFGFCEFESAEGVLRALRLLSKFNIDGQEFVLNVNQATRDYLERYVEKKTENAKKLNEAPATRAEKGENALGDEKNVSSTPSVEDSKDSDNGKKENIGIANSAIVTDEDREADRDASEKLASMIEERLKTNPLPPPPPQTAPDGSGKSNSDLPAKLRDGDSDADVMRNDGAEGKNDDGTTRESKATTENDQSETSSPDRRYDRRSRDTEQDLKREKEREIERLERETERERIRKEREQRRKIEEAEREYEKFLRDWELREKDKEKQRQYEKEREKEREHKRKKEIRYDEEDDDDLRKKWRRSALEEKRRKRLREKEDDFADRLKEEKEIAEAKKREEEQLQLQQQRDALRLLSGRVANGGEKTVLVEEASTESKDKAIEQHYKCESSYESQIFDDGIMQNGSVDESNMAFVAASDARQSGNAPARKLGFGLVGSGKRTTVPSVFHEEEDDDAQKDKKMRPLVPIDYSTEELQAVQPGTPTPNLVAAAEFAKRISNVNPKEEKPDAERERSRRSYDKSSRDKDHNHEDKNRTRDASKEKIPDWDKDREHGQDKVKTTDHQKLLDAKQLIDMIPKTKEELFSYEINWDVYDQHALHERMRPWISKKITEFLGEEEKTLVDYIVSSTQEHVKASQMLELLQSILDEEAEMFVLKMWRMLIFEIKKVETGLALRSRG
ncbi:RNA-binding protein 25-like isoform X2 [Durio zibethinus]|nr:RNA-binding protein 25-like isoform X2 [Durio zibethinus]XP_022776077.1 RNA-binding protein 25-like isoform X2 [Durio zibethinus]XP_022776078.1 RNA-binding protein 25-like isoform X2 [Durio zibethinus]XP_022776079.1 RNA-binding protein 25-like isoform X2 [Durio zibethinus]XP_022776080.1 RNA-binding protein 25-like isoform X2 [Durio zibethinus]